MPNASTLQAAERLLAALDALESACAHLDAHQPDPGLAQRHAQLQQESRSVLSDIDALLSQLRGS